jgi:hypothetical protein
MLIDGQVRYRLAGEVMIKRLSGILAVGTLALMFALCMGTASAQPRDRDRDFRGRPGPGFNHYDGRFNHDRYYPERGFAYRELPRDRYLVESPRGRYFYYGGVWYAPGPDRYVVVGAPVGAFVPVLPPSYTTVWIDGVPYYYANDTYYTWRQSDNQYEVVTPPDEQSASTEAPPPPPSPNDDIFVYPKNGQSEADQSRDKYECHKWAQSESGFDPTQPNGGVSPDQANAKRASYQRAMAACLEGRGYSVK